MIPGINIEDNNKIMDVFKNYNKIKNVILFGSRAKGNYSLGSDVDIAIKGDNLNLDDIINLQIILDNLFLPYIFDIIIYDKIKEPLLIEHIDRIGKNLLI